ncbi:hypothetical protein AB0M02_38305 [Actinoplanes sp. NPDC051861]|uniref:hypothetical protein n=1 Tax=Actinoplanes sp. NPDC051861 TaxID=3155170 RepID=UPI0034251299
MGILLVATIGLIIATALAVWPGTRRSPSSVEGLLVLRRVNGEITREEYVREVELLAARDEQLHPLTVPGDDHPGACG